jgi:hypothetical protein
VLALWGPVPSTLAIEQSILRGSPAVMRHDTPQDLLPLAVGGSS